MSGKPVGNACFAYGVVIRIAVVAGLGGFLLGFDTVVISGTNETLERVFNLNAVWAGFTVAIAPIGTILGTLVVGRPSDAFGRKKALFALAIGYFISALGCGFARTWCELLAARFLGGVAIGGASVVTPMYIAEISPPRLRGRLVMVNQFNIVLGVLLSFVSNYLIARYFEFDVAWRWMLGLLALPAAAFFLAIFAIPESPRSLVRRKRSAEARQVLERLGDADVERELAAIQASLLDRTGQVRERLFGRPVLAPRAAGLHDCHVQSAHRHQRNPVLRTENLQPCRRPAGPVLAAIHCRGHDPAGVHDRRHVPHRPLWTADPAVDRIGGHDGLLGLARGHVRRQSQGARGLILAGLLGAIALFALSQGAVMFVFISEIFPNAVRAKGQALGTFIHWSMAAAVTWSFPIVAQHCVAGAFGFFAAMMALQFLFVWKIMPETKGGALEDIEKRLAAAERI